MFLAVFFHWMSKFNAAAIKSRLRLPKSEIRFRMASSFSDGITITFMRKRVEKSQAIVALLGSIQELHLEW